MYVHMGSSTEDHPFHSPCLKSVSLKIPVPRADGGALVWQRLLEQVSVGPALLLVPRVLNEDSTCPAPFLMGHILLKPQLSLDPTVYLPDSEQGLQPLSQSLLLEAQAQKVFLQGSDTPMPSFPKAGRGSDQLWPRCPGVRMWLGALVVIGGPSVH